MVKAISRYTFLLRPGETRLVVKRGVAYQIAEEEYKRFQSKFILYSDYANQNKEKGK